MMEQKAPVSLILPTLNCKAELKRHLEALRPVFSQVAEIISVDSESSDGTQELLRENLASYPHARFLSRPPGLYASWNVAMQEATQPWVYFSTIGDIITREGLSKLLRIAAETKADIIVSPPKMLEADGITPSNCKWPIHHYASSCTDTNARAFTSIETTIALCSFITGTILGSSASNIYRTEFLKTHPFPEDFGHAGDTVWGLRYCREVQMILYPCEVATFTQNWQFTATAALTQRDVFLQLSKEAQNTLAADRSEEGRILHGWFTAMLASKLVLWDWLASNEDLHQNYHQMLNTVKNLEMQLQQRFPERIWLAIQRIFFKIASS